LSIAGEINSYKDPLSQSGYRQRTHCQVCNNPNQRDALQLVERVESAAVLATNQARMIDGLSTKSKSLEVDINNCISMIQKHNTMASNVQSSLTDLSRIEKTLKPGLIFRGCFLASRQCRGESEILRRRLDAKLAEIKSEGLDPKEDLLPGMTESYETCSGEYLRMPTKEIAMPRCRFHVAEIKA